MCQCTLIQNHAHASKVGIHMYATYANCRTCLARLRDPTYYKASHNLQVENVKHSDQHLVSEAVPSIMAQSWLWGSQIAVKKSPIQKKGEKQVINNYRPISLLPIYGKYLRDLIFNSLFQNLKDHNLLSAHQLGF